VPHLIPAAHKGDMGGCSFFGFRDDGSRFLLMNIFGGGWGGRPDEDGEDASVSVCQGDVRNTPVELQEIKYPVLIETHALRADSGGEGRHRGGLGLELTYKLLQNCKANINMDRTLDPPWGLHGGKPGAVNACIIRRTDGTALSVKKATEVEIAAGDRVTFLTAGGGGYGDPRERAPAEIAHDIAAGFVSKKGGS
jgi:N-methylhydantoinase B